MTIPTIGDVALTNQQQSHNTIISSNSFADLEIDPSDEVLVISNDDSTPGTCDESPCAMTHNESCAFIDK